MSVPGLLHRSGSQQDAATSYRGTLKALASLVGPALPLASLRPTQAAVKTGLLTHGIYK